MASIIKVDTIQTAAGGTPTAADLGVTLPTSVNFYVRSNVDQTGLSDLSKQVVEYNVVDFDSTSSFSTSTNIFTVPQTGVYVFMANAFLFGGSLNTRDSYLGFEVSRNSGSSYTPVSTTGVRWRGNEDIEGNSIPVSYMASMTQGDLIRVIATVNTGDGGTWSILPNTAPYIGYGLDMIDNDNVFTSFGGYRIA